MIYYTIISLGVCLASLWFLQRSVQARQPRVRAADIALVVMISGFIGARLMHVFYEEPAYYHEHPWAILQVWNGGYVFLGGLLAALFGTALFCDWRKEPFWMWADLATPPAALAYAIGRLGCFFNGCCYGRVCTLPWAVNYRHPTQLYATLWESVTIVILLLLAPRFKMPGSLIAIWFILHGCGRLMMEHFRDDPRGPLLAGLSISTWLSLVLIGAGLSLLVTRLVPRLQRH